MMLKSEWKGVVAEADESEIILHAIQLPYDRAIRTVDVE